MRGEHSEIPLCSFCGKTQEEVEVLIANPSDNRAFICNECVAVCHSVLEEYHKAKETNEEARLTRLKAFTARR